MDIQEVFSSIKNDLEAKFDFLPDKPEETVESTIKACWFTASGSPKSSVEAEKYALPELTSAQFIVFRQLIKRRLNNVPLAHLTGRQHFNGIELLSDKRALIPRRETELLAKKALELTHEVGKKKSSVMVMDICCGAGNLGLSLAMLNPRNIVFASDLSHDAVALTKDNISFLNLHERVHAEQGDLFSAFSKETHFKNTDLIICNPPYISSKKVGKMKAEILDHEPYQAFDGGVSGATIIGKLISEAPAYLNKKGWVIFEVGIGQGEYVALLCRRLNYYSEIKYIHDALGNIRVIMARK